MYKNGSVIGVYPPMTLPVPRHRPYTTGVFKLHTHVLCLFLIATSFLVNKDEYITNSLGNNNLEF